MLLDKLRVPSIVGMIFAGVLIGPHGFGVLERDTSFELFGKVGLYYIMFLASLEMNLQDVQRIKGRAATLGLLSFVIPMGIGYAANSMLGYGAAAAVLMAAMYASHTLIAYPIVLRYGLSRLDSVSIAVGGTIVADTLTLLVLAVVGGVFKEHVTGLYWLWLLVKVVALGGIIIYSFPRIGRWFFRRYDDSVVQYVFVLCLVFLGAGLMEFVGMEGILGAFLVGLVLNRLIPPSSPLMSHIEFVGNALFIPFFLIGVGTLINLGALVEHEGAIVVAAVMVAVGLGSKWLACFVTQKAFKMSLGERRLMFGLTGSRAAAPGGGACGLQDNTARRQPSAWRRCAERGHGAHTGDVCGKLAHNREHGAQGGCGATFGRHCHYGCGPAGGRGSRPHTHGAAQPLDGAGAG